MILSGNAIRREVDRGMITIDPYEDAMANPNSHNYRLGPHLIEVQPESERAIEIPSSGFVLRPDRLYLGHTIERIGSRVFTPSLIGRSSMARLGLYLVVDADHGQLGRAHRWTLELRAVVPLRIYAGMVIGQVSFWRGKGDDPGFRDSRYTKADLPTHSHLLGHRP